MLVGSCSVIVEPSSSYNAWNIRLVVVYQSVMCCFIGGYGELA